MDGVLGLLLFAVLFFVMMHFGCGAHVMHGGHGHRGHRDEGGPAGSGRDPVCGMDVAADRGYSMSRGGRLYRFCSRQCLDRFEAEPAKFAIQPEGKAGRRIA